MGTGAAHVVYADRAAIRVRHAIYLNETAREAHACSLAQTRHDACPARPVPYTSHVGHLKRVACAAPSPPTACTASSVKHLGAAMESRGPLHDDSSARQRELEEEGVD